MKFWQPDDVKGALNSLHRNPWRSFVTMFGIIISVVAVVTTVSISDGVKRQITDQVNRLGQNLITVRPGQTVTKNGTLQSIGNFLSPQNNGSLSSQDYQTVQQTPGVALSAPLGVVPGAVEANGTSYSGTSVGVIATTSDLPRLLNESVAFGDFFQPEDYGKNVAVIGARLAQALFQTDVPLGQTFTFDGQDFIVRGIMQNYDTPTLSLDSDFNSAIFIPYQTAQQLEKTDVPIYKILAKPKSGTPITTVRQNIATHLQAAHGNVTDFAVLDQQQSNSTTSTIIALMTRLTVGVAAIALFVGGVGIMNTMWLIVTERTREIGIRKAIGATNRQIRHQFMMETLVISAIGSFAGIIVSLLIDAAIIIFTNWQPVIPVLVMLLTAVITTLVGMIFGIIPALKAARKEPIDALRND